MYPGPHFNFLYELRFKQRHPLIADINSDEYDLSIHNLNSHFFLNESYGVFDYTEKHYLKLFKDLIVTSKFKLEHWRLNKIINGNITKFWKDNPQEFFKFELNNLDTTKLKDYNHKQNLFKNIDTLKIYITYNATDTIIGTISDNSLDNDIIIEELPVSCVTNDKITVSIIL